MAVDHDRSALYQPGEHPGDMLEASASVIRFLADVCPIMNHDQQTGYISNRGSAGLNIILSRVEESIDAAREKL